MIAKVKKIDSNGDVSFFNIVGIDEDDCYSQVEELNDWSRENEFYNNYYLIQEE